MARTILSGIAGVLSVCEYLLEQRVCLLRMPNSNRTPRDQRPS